MPIIGGHHVLALQSSPEGWQGTPLLERCREHAGRRGARGAAARVVPRQSPHGSTWASLIPFCVKAALSQPVPADHRFRLWAPAVALPELVDSPLGIRTVGLWGMTETITPSIIADPERPSPFMCIGRPAPGYDIQVRDGDGKPLGLGGEGRLFVRGVPGVTLFKEYLDDPAATAASFDAEGWFDTGDRVRIAENGDMFFLDREKDMLKVGGENVAASEIEAVILATGLVNEVAVVGQRHAMLDEVPVAFVIASDAPDDLEEQLIAACRKKLAAFKVIRAVHRVDDLPRSTLEKVAKNVLRDRLPEIRLQPGAPRRPAVDFDRAGDQHLADPTATGRQDDRVILGAERNDRLIGLDDAAQRLALRVDHGPTQLGAQHPGGSVRAEAELALQLDGRDAVGVCRHQICRPEPRRQRQLAGMYDRPGRHGGLPPAGGTLIGEGLCLQKPGSAVTAAGAYEPFRPAPRKKVFRAHALARKTPLEFDQRLRKPALGPRHGLTLLIRDGGEP